MRFTLLVGIYKIKSKNHFYYIHLKISMLKQNDLEKIERYINGEA